MGKSCCYVRDLRLDEKSAQLAECKKRIAVLEVQLNLSQGTLTRRYLLESALRLSWLWTNEFDATQAALKLEDHAAESAPDSPAAILQECAKGDTWGSHSRMGTLWVNRLLTFIKSFLKKRTVSGRHPLLKQNRVRISSPPIPWSKLSYVISQ